MRRRLKEKKVEFSLKKSLVYNRKIKRNEKEKKIRTGQKEKRSTF